jgi:hypothetical protein
VLRTVVPVLVLSLLLTGCGESPFLTPVGEPTPAEGVDDDDITGDDDDTAADEPVSATFAATLNGQVDDPDASPGMVRTKLDGEFQFVYWDAGQAPLCRDRFRFVAEGHFGPLMVGACGACAGILSFLEIERATLGDIDDGCVDLPASRDLSFLLDPSAGESTPDFRNLALVSLALLREMEFPIGVDGTTADELITSYGELGLEATYIAMVRPGGWLGTNAELGEVASAWDELGWLPMFVLYKDADRPGNSLYLEGEVFMTSLWQVALESGDEGDDGPGLGGNFALD